MGFCMDMNVRKLQVGLVMVALVSVSGSIRAKADLPSLDDRKWVGCFAALETKLYEFSLTTQGKGKLEVIGKKGTPIGHTLGISIEFLVQETLPDGKVVTKAVRADTLESPQPATLKPENLVIRGKVTGDAEFEAYLTEARGTISVGGKLLSPGTLTKNPLRFGIRVNLPNAYPYENGKSEEKDSKADAKKAAKALEEKTKNDRLQLKFTDGKARKQSLTEAVDASSAEVNGPGISALSWEVSTFQDKKILLVASENSVMKLTNGTAKPMNTGFAVTWTPDLAKDPDTKARLTIDVK